MKHYAKKILPVLIVAALAATPSQAGAISANTALGIFQLVVAGPGIATFAGLGATKINDAIKYLQDMPQTNLRASEVERLKGAQIDYWFGVSAGIAEALLGGAQIGMEYAGKSPKWMIAGEVASLAVIIASVVSNGLAIGKVSSACDNNRCTLTPQQLAEFKDNTNDLAYNGWDGASLISFRAVSAALDGVSLFMAVRSFMQAKNAVPDNTKPGA